MRPPRHLKPNPKDAQQAVRHSKLLDRLTRVGFLSIGVVYGILGSLALITALRLIGATHTRRGALTDVPGTIRRIAEQPFGPLALAIIAVGLLSYALWRLLAAFLDSEHEGRTFQALSTRAGYLGRGLIYAGVAAYAIRGVFGPAHLRQGDTLPKWSARVMSMPAGRWLVAAAALSLVWVGILEVRRGIRREFKRYLRLEEMTSVAIRWTTATGTGGHIARGILFGLMGLSGLLSAILASPREARGPGRTLAGVAAQPFGPWLLALLAAGITVYGVFCILQARYRRIRA